MKITWNQLVNASERGNNANWKMIRRWEKLTHLFEKQVQWCQKRTRNPPEPDDDQFSSIVSWKITRESAKVEIEFEIHLSSDFTQCPWRSLWIQTQINLCSWELSSLAKQDISRVWEWIYLLAHLIIWKQLFCILIWIHKQTLNDFTLKRYVYTIKRGKTKISFCLFREISVEL